MLTKMVDNKMCDMPKFRIHSFTLCYALVLQELNRVTTSSMETLKHRGQKEIALFGVDYL